MDTSRSVWLRFHRDDVQRVREMAPDLQYLEELEDLDTGEDGEACLEDVPWGGGKDLATLAAERLRFIGWYTAGLEYPAAEFYSNAGDDMLHEWNTDDHGGYSVSVQISGDIPGDQIEGLREYVRAHAHTNLVIAESYEREDQ